ncbi:hypothetical protein FHX28_001585 [Clostridium beijerinckii]|nr:hypothetical protein [Clostridium beijerinckii]
MNNRIEISSGNRLEYIKSLYKVYPVLYEINKRIMK